MFSAPSLPESLLASLLSGKWSAREKQVLVGQQTNKQKIPFLSTVGRNKREETEAFKDLAGWRDKINMQSEPSEGLSSLHTDLNLSSQRKGNTGNAEL